jgi:hypothetical protein
MIAALLTFAFGVLVGWLIHETWSWGH